MADEDVQVAPIQQPVLQHCGDYTHNVHPHLGLVILEWSFAVAQAALHARQDQVLAINHPEVQICATMRVGFWPYHGVLDLAGMVAAHIIKGDIEHTDHEFQVVVGQITAAQDQTDISEAFFYLGAVDRIDLLITQ